MDQISLAGAYQSVKAVKEILSTLFDAKVESEAKEKISYAQSKVGEIQDVLFLLRERISELQEDRDSLKKELEVERDWKSKMDLYALSYTPGGAVVYKYKDSPEHYACPSCFNKKEIHILQDKKVMLGIFQCTGCNSDYPIKQPTSYNPVSPLKL